MEEIVTMQDYFTRMDKKLGRSFASHYPVLHEYYEELKSACSEVNQHPRNNLFDTLKEVLSLDAQLQILLEYHKITESHFREIASEEELISQIKKDSRSFYRELVGLNTSSEIPIGIIYLGDGTKIS
ncbi:hypothetical protein JZO83_04330 [Enterococcus sp. DIV1298c]|uniref:DUF7006 family protein n=1 Tax=Enterococcus sp. DIV1298c TaxID=2815328 RepID=UPI001A92E505|nr:hypothetical protein [Enterococcus sp. DIV1298c]MBO0460968.1 hypothetical protein [Enterococcus sp. DIV1298c]